MDYTAGIKHKFSISESHVSVPEKLLKSKDLSETYIFMSRTKELVERVKMETLRMKEEEDGTFLSQKSKMETFVWLTIL